MPPGKVVVSGEGEATDDDSQQPDGEPSEELEPTLEDVMLPDAVAGFDERRVALVKRAAKEWAAALIDLGGRNNLLRYRDLRAGTLDISRASPVAVEALLASRPVRTSALFPDPEERSQQLHRVRTIHRKAKENYEERGILPGFPFGLIRADAGEKDVEWRCELAADRVVIIDVCSREIRVD